MPCKEKKDLIIYLSQSHENVVTQLDTYTFPSLVITS